ncbi:geminin coiled-coil domain-containing protein 1 [Ammospiza caudacuta]|uniref:geminin coiled-coil domain-containing protein 1 n=1 Tax=Ammospiza caudacuta TaxID=2857398 RepID=UPI002738FFBE|nr:geminin coiled-coil domain-containing protein 1 [Ammospiza caudacuta]
MAAVRALRGPEALAGPGGTHGAFASRTGLLRALRAPPACPPRDVSSPGFTRLSRAVTQRPAARLAPEQRCLSGVCPSHLNLSGALTETCSQDLHFILPLIWKPSRLPGTAVLGARGCGGWRGGTARARRTERCHRETGSGHRVRAGRCPGTAPEHSPAGRQWGERCPAGALLAGPGRHRFPSGPPAPPSAPSPRPFPPQSAGRPCPQPDFAGGSGCAWPWSAPAGVSKETWAAVCAAEPPHSQGRPQGQVCSPQLGAQDAAWQGDQLSSQLYRNKQLQDTLLQKEEELARLHEENNNLRQYLNSALIKCLEEKAKKLLSDHGQKTCAILKSTKRRLKEDHFFVPQETPHASKARRNLSNEFTACEEQASPAVDSWVLQTLGLKDVNTIDEASANYSALSPDLGKDTYCLSPGGAADCEHREGAAAVFSCSHEPPGSSSTHPCSQDSPFLPQFSSAPCISSPVPSVSSLPAYGLPYWTGGLSPNRTEVAFTTCLSPHRNVRTHSFHQGQAFVRRDDDGGWRFTWVPKQSE